MNANTAGEGIPKDRAKAAALGVAQCIRLVEKASVPDSLRPDLVRGLRQVEKGLQKGVVPAVAALESFVARLDEVSGLDVGWNEAQKVWEATLTEIKAHLLPTVWPDFEARLDVVRHVAGCHHWVIERPFQKPDYGKRDAALGGTELVLAEIQSAPIDEWVKRDLGVRVRGLAAYWNAKKPDFVQYGIDMVDTIDHISALQGTQIPEMTANRVKQGLVIGPIAAGPALAATCAIPIIGEILIVVQVVAVVVIVGGLVITLLFKSSKAKRAFANIKRKLGTKAAKDIVDEETKDLNEDEKKEVKDALDKNVDQLEKGGATSGGDTPQDKELDKLKEAADAMK